MGMIHRIQPSPSLSLFKNRPRLPINGVGRLPLGMTINSVTVEPDFVFCAGAGMVDVAEWRPYKYGEALSRVAVGVAPTVGWGSPYLGCLDDSVKFNGSDYYQAGNNTFGDIGTEDFVFEFVLRKSGSALYVLDKRGAGGIGWYIATSATAIQLYLNDGSASTSNSAALTTDAWYHCMIFADRSGSSQWYIDGVASGAPTVISAEAGTLTRALAFTMCGRTDNGSSPYNSNVAYLAMWKRAAWLDTHLQPTVARHRANLLQGVHPYMARGTATPTVQTRASVAHLDRVINGVTKYFHMGVGALRLSERVDKNGKRLKGYLPETQATNLITYSTTSEGNWTKQDAGDTTSTGVSSPFGATAEGWIADATDGSHRRILTVTTTAAEHTFWGIFKSGLEDWVALYDSVSTVGRYFDLANGVLGGVVTGAPTNSYIVNLGDGWWLCAIVYTTTAAARSAAVYPSEADGDSTYAGDGVNPSILFAHAQVEIGNYHTSPIITDAGAAVIREEDSLRFKGDDGNLGGVGSNKAGDAHARILLPNVNIAVGSGYIFNVSNGGSNNDRMSLFYNTSDVMRFVARAGGADVISLTGTSDPADNAVHDIEAKYQTADGDLLVDGASEDTDTSGTDMPDEQDRIDVGVASAGTLQTNGLVADLEFFDRVLRERNAS